MNVMYFIFLIFFVCLGVIHLVNLFQYFLYNSYASSQKFYKIVIIPVKGHVEDVEMLARKYISKEKNSKFFKQTRIFFLADKLDSKTKEVLEKICQAHNFTICTQEEIYDILRKAVKKI